MNLHELLQAHAMRPHGGVPDAFLGWYKRYSISFCDGLTDVHTHVCWLQSRHFTIDLRLPRVADQPPLEDGLALRLGDPGKLAGIPAATWLAWANFEGWKAPATWDGQRLTWHPPQASLQWHDRWPEPAILHRVGPCMIEFCDSGAYVEDWRLQPSAPGPLIGLHLLHETDDETGALRHVGGGWIVAGDHAALVLGRPGALPEQAAPTHTLRDEVAALLAAQPTPGPVEAAAATTAPATPAPTAASRLQALFAFETSVASLQDGEHRVLLSTCPDRIGEVLSPTDGFTWLGTIAGADEASAALIPEALRDLPRVCQKLTQNGRAVTRLFAVDTLEPHIDFSQQTTCAPTAQAWMAREATTLQRYTAVLGDAMPEDKPAS
jgi:hypothetical protein